MVHKSRSEIKGTVTYKEDGKTYYAQNALVALQNKKRTKTYKYTNTNDSGEYSFHPVKKKRKYTVAATLEDYDGLKKFKKKIKKYGKSYTKDITLR